MRTGSHWKVNNKLFREFLIKTLFWPIFVMKTTNDVEMAVVALAVASLAGVVVPTVNEEAFAEKIKGDDNPNTIVGTPKMIT